MLDFVHLLLLGVSASLLVAAASTAAAAAGARGLERAIAAAPIAGSAAVVEALALGLVGLGTTPAALWLAALATWILARRLFPHPKTSMPADVLAWWRQRSRLGRLAVGCLAGAFAGWTAGLLYEPRLGIDPVIYHLAEVVAWVHSGQPGSVEQLLHGFPVGNYPLTSEVLLAWVLGQARSFTPTALWGPGFLTLLAAAGWVGLRELRVPPPASAVALVALCTTPIAVAQLEGPNTDLAATAWLAVAGALVAVAGSRPALLAPALLAAGLSVGTKTTTAVLVVALAAAALAWRRPQQLRPLAIPLALATLVAVVAGGTWYLRNLLDHGSPLWPFVTLPWGDPPPPLAEQLQHSLLDRPRATLSGRVDDYARVLGGAVALIAGGILVPLLARTRRSLLAAGGTALGLFAWMNAPITGAADRPEIAFYAGTTTRYLLPVAAAGALSLALCCSAADRPRARHGVDKLALLVLAGSVGWSVLAVAKLVKLPLPADWILLPAIAVGALGALIADRIWQPRLRDVHAAGALALVASAGVLAAAVPGYAARHANANLFEADVVRWFSSQPSFEHDKNPVAMGPVVVALLAGDRLQRRLELLPSNAGCREVVAHLRRGKWVVLKDPRLEERLTSTPYRPAHCMLDRAPVFEKNGFRVYHRGS